MNDTTMPATPHPERQSARAQLRSAALRADVIRVAIQVAATHDRLADTLRRLAERQPGQASRLSARFRAAENHAARTRHLASALRDGIPPGGGTLP